MATIKKSRVIRRVTLQALCMEPIGSPTQLRNRNAKGLRDDVTAFSSSMTVIFVLLFSYSRSSTCSGTMIGTRKLKCNI